MQSSHLKNPEVLRNRNKQFLLLCFVIFIILFLLFAWVTVTFNVRGITHGSWLDSTSSILAICGVLLSVLQLICWKLFSFYYNESEVSSFISSRSLSPVIPHVDQRLSQEGPTMSTAHRSIVGLPSSTDPRTIVQRKEVVEDIYRNLTRPDTTAIVLTGIDGVGKSTLAALVYRYAEEQIREKKNRSFTAQPLWLVIDPDVTMRELASNLFEALEEPIPDFDKLAPHSQAVALFKALDTTEQARLIVLDQFEYLLDWQTGHVIADPGISELLIALNSGRCKCKLLFTSRSWPQGPQMYPHTYMQEYQVKGLEINQGIELLRKQGIAGTERELSKAVKYCAGHAFALTLLAALLRNRRMSLGILFEDRTYAQLWMGNVADNLLNYIYQQLSEMERKVLLAFSVYREPVPLDAVKTIINSSFEVTTTEIQLALGVLIRQHLLQASGEGRYQLHAIVSRQAQEHFVGGDKQENQQVLKMAHVHAALYYLRQSIHSPLRGQRREIGDVHPFIEAIWHKCHAEQWQDAYELMEQEQIFTDLKRWGANAILLELYQLFLPLEKWHPRHPETVRILTNLGRIYRTLGQRERARENLEQALGICREIGDRWAEGTVLSFLGRVYADLGQKEKALKHLQEALMIRKEIDDREGESWTLDTLSQVYDDLGEVDRAKEYSEQALMIREELGDRKGRGRILNTLAHIYDNLGQREQAKRYLEEALRICREERDRTGEALTLNRLGLFSASFEEVDTAREYYEEALKIRREIGDRAGEDRTLNNLGSLYNVLGEREQARNYFEQALHISQEAEDRWGEGRILANLGMLCYEQRQMESALEYLEKALKLSRETGDRRGEGRALQILGQIYAALGEKEQALRYFEQARRIGQRTKDGKGEAWTLYHIGRFYFKQESYDVALACFLLAEDIFEKIQSPNRDVVQQWIDTLSNTLGDAQFIELAAQVEPQAQKIVDQALHYGLQ